MSDTLTAELRFSIIPEWILDSGISDKAIRLYCVLARYADNETHRAYPSRETLAQRMECSKASVDRAAQELMDVGAMTKQQRHNSSLVFTLRVSSPMQRGVITDDEGGSSLVMRGVVTDDDLTITTELEPENIEPLNDIDEQFNEFWSLYPRKKGKGQARRAFEKALEKTDIETILAGVEAYMENEPMDDPQFIAHPTTWLNGERWDDEYEQRVVRETPGPGRREWVRAEHLRGDHWACEPGEFPEGCE